MPHKITSVRLLAYSETLRLALPLPDRAYFDSWPTNMKREIANHIATAHLSLEDAISRVHHMHINKRREMIAMNPLKQPTRPTSKKGSRT